MSIDRDTEALLSAVLTEHAENRPEPASVLAHVHQRIAEPPHHTAVRPVPVLAAVAAVAVIATGVTVLAEHAPTARSTAGGTRQATPTARITHPDYHLTNTCLNIPHVLAGWGNVGGPYGGIAYDKPGGQSCTQEADTVQPTHPQATSSDRVGSRTVYLAESPAGIRTGYLVLNAAESAAAARGSGRGADTNRTYYMIISIPADNAPSTLIKILAETVLPGHGPGK